MAITLAFDVYGTLIDTAGVTEALCPYAGDRAPAFAQAWREKQLEYTFRRALMQHYRDFAVCTEQSLVYMCAAFGVQLTAEQRNGLLDAYRHLPAFPDAHSGLVSCKQLSLRLFAFSNGRADDVSGLLREAGLLAYFEDVVSLLDVQTFKPNPAAYAYFHRRAGTGGDETWLISSNPFDVIGAVSAGMKAAWLKRSTHAIFDPWEIQPTLTVASLGELAPALRARGITSQCT